MPLVCRATRPRCTRGRRSSRISPSWTSSALSNRPRPSSSFMVVAWARRMAPTTNSWPRSERNTSRSCVRTTPSSDRTSSGRSGASELGRSSRSGITSSTSDRMGGVMASTRASVTRSSATSVSATLVNRSVSSTVRLAHVATDAASTATAVRTTSVKAITRRTVAARDGPLSTSIASLMPCPSRFVCPGEAYGRDRPAAGTVATSTVSRGTPRSAPGPWRRPGPGGPPAAGGPRPPATTRPRRRPPPGCCHSSDTCTSGRSAARSRTRSFQASAASRSKPSSPVAASPPGRAGRVSQIAQSNCSARRSIRGSPDGSRSSRITSL